MKCSRDSCQHEAVIYREYEGRALCKECFTHSVEKKVKATIRQEDLIDYDDRIGVGLSGGKDSSTLLHLLHKFFNDREDLEIVAIAIDEGIRNYRELAIDEAQTLCDRLGIDLHITSFEDLYGVTTPEVAAADDDMTPCTYCGVMRRDALNTAAQALDCTKLAIGHNLDDELQAAMMNYLRGDLPRLGRMGAKIEDDSLPFVPRIKPMREILEYEVTVYAQLHDLEMELKECPVRRDEETLRLDIQEFLNEMEHKYPSTKYTMLATLDKLIPLAAKQFSQDTKQQEAKKCGECGSITSGSVCRKCQLVQRAKRKRGALKDSGEQVRDT